MERITGLLVLAVTLLHLVVGPAVPAVEFVTFPDDIDHSDEDSSPPACCQGPNIISCRQVNISSAALENPGSISSPDGIVNYVTNLDDDPDAFYFKGEEGTDLTIVCSNGRDRCFGVSTDNAGRRTRLEYCSDGSHVWKQVDLSRLEVDVPVMLSTPDIPDISGDEWKDIDTKTPSEISIKFYYTPDAGQAANSTGIEEVVRFAVKTTNQIYKNTGVPLTAKALCIEEINISESPNVLTTFTELMETDLLLDTADVAVLLIKDFDYCGKSFVGGSMKGLSLAVVRTDCAVERYSVAHEIGHIMGMSHDEATTKSQNIQPFYPFGQGYLIEQGISRNRSGFATVMAYPQEGHGFRVPYFSDPAKLFPETRTVLGNPDTADNVKVLKMNRLQLGQVGDESSPTCRNGRHIRLAPDSRADEEEESHVVNNSVEDEEDAGNEVEED